MGQEFVIKSTALEDKINQLLPTQGGAQAGVDLSASSMIVPIVDLTESAEGSALRQDLQRSFSLTNTTAFSKGPSVTDEVIINTTGYWLIKYTAVIGANAEARINISDGTTTKELVTFGGFVTAAFYESEISVFLAAGEDIRISAEASTRINGAFRQIADISGNLIDPV